MTKSIATLYINLQRISPKDKKAPLFFKHQIAGKHISLQTKIRVKPEKWKQELQKVEGDETLTKELFNIRQSWGLRLQIGLEEKSSIEEIKNLFKQSIRKELIKAVNSNRKQAYYDLFDQYIEVNKKQKTESHLRKFTTTKNSLKQYYPNLHFTELKQKLLQEYHDHLIDRELTNNTIRDHFKIMKVIAKYGNSMGFNIPWDIKDYNIKAYSPEKIWLTMQELQAFEEVECKKNSEQLVKDWFLFRCYTGMRFSDMQHVDVLGLTGNELTFNIQKQRKLHKIPLGQKSLAILKKYKKWPKYTQQYENRTIKVLCKRVGIDTIVETSKLSGFNWIKSYNPKHEVIKGHDARRTFARLAYERNIPLLTISRIIGHSSEKQTQDYIGVVAQEMQGVTM
jgi:integrase